MKLRYLFTALAGVLLSGAAQAVPAYPGVLTLKNPDGSTIEVRAHGDEHFSYVTAAGTTDIYEQNAAGYWVRAERGGKFLTASDRSDLEMLMDEQGTVESIRAQAKQARVGADGRSMFPCTGNNKFLIVLLEYKDTKFTMEDPQALYTRWFNEKNFTYQDMSHSAKDYYEAVSGGKFTPTFVVAPKVTLKNSSAYYVGNSKYQLFSRAISEAFVQLNDAKFDFSAFDIDKDGIMDNVFFIYAGYGQADTQDRTTIWPHKSNVQGQNIQAGNLKVGPYACASELRGSSHYISKDGILESIGTFCHEFGHVLGLPDLYDPEYSAFTDDQVPGSWTIMCNGPYLNDSRTPPTYTAYEKWVCRWLEFEDLEAGKSYELAPLSEQVRGLRLTVPTSASASEYYVIESRSRVGWDEYVPGEGLVIWHVDFNASIWDSNRVNSTPGRPRCSVVVPSGLAVDGAHWPAAGLYGSVIAPEMPNSLKPFNALKGDFTPGFVNIAYNPETRKSSFDYTTTLQPFTAKTDFIQCNKFDWRTGIGIEWNPVPGAVKYAVTVKRRNSSGSEFFVDGYDNKIVEGTNCFVSESATIMKTTHWVEVRAISSQLPSTEMACTDYFVPEDLPASVNGVQEDEVEIIGGHGCITAPDEAEVYNLQGMSTGKENLPAGIYVVRYKGLTKKVMVK